jgi:hypothetical protein
MKKKNVKAEKMKQVKSRIFSVDWAHENERQQWYDGTDFIGEPKLKKGDIVLTENIPSYKAVELLEKGVKILTCHTMSSKEHRDFLGQPRLKYYNNDGHKIDAFVIYDLYATKPHLFNDYKINIMKMLYSNFIQIQKTRTASQLRAWSKKAKDMTNSTIEFLVNAENESEKTMDKYGKGEIVYDYVRNIRQVGPRTGCGLVALADATRFEHASQLRRYAGLSVIDGEVQKLRVGQSNGFDTELKALLLKRIADGFIKSSGTKYPSAYYLDYEYEKNRLKKIPPKSVDIDDEKHIVGDLLAEKIGKFKKGERIYKHQYAKLKEACVIKGVDSVLIQLADGHIHARAIRKMMQLFLEDYWVISRQLQGFSTIPPYITTVGKHNGYRKPRYIPKILEPFDPLRDVGWVFETKKRPWSQASEYIKDKCGKPTD